MDVGEDAEKREPSYTGGGNESRCSHTGKQYGASSKLKIELLYDPGTALLGIYPKDTNSDPKGHLHPNVYSSNVHNSQTMERALMSINKGMDKEDIYTIE